MEFAIASLNSQYIHSMEIAISTKIGFPYYVFPPNIKKYFHSKDFEKISSGLIFVGDSIEIQFSC
jgi:hypothetical protein